VATSAVTLRWTGTGLRFEGGRVDGPHILVDSDGAAGPSPTTVLMLALAGCMAVDMVDIAAKMRLPLTGLDVALEGERRETPPRRFTAMRLRFATTGVAPADEPKLRRAIELSRDKYCSVWHTLKDDIDLGIELELL
jgi:putative redox protein